MLSHREKNEDASKQKKLGSMYLIIVAFQRNALLNPILQAINIRNTNGENTQKSSQRFSKACRLSKPFCKKTPENSNLEESFNLRTHKTKNPIERCHQCSQSGNILLASCNLMSTTTFIWEVSSGQTFIDIGSTQGETL